MQLGCGWDLSWLDPLFSKEKRVAKGCFFLSSKMAVAISVSPPLPYVACTHNPYTERNVGRPFTKNSIAPHTLQLIFFKSYHISLAHSSIVCCDLIGVAIVSRTRKAISRGCRRRNGCRNSWPGERWIRNSHWLHERRT